MNKIVREHYPASKLPADLREGLGPDAKVTVTIETDERPEAVLTLDEILAMRRPVFKSGEEADDFVRKLRDEWA
jgi:hypothetical protein